MFSVDSKLIIKFLDDVLNKKISINVIGDNIVDEYYDVDVERISPEFPIPVYKSNSMDPSSGLIPGGAANVAAQFSFFNVNVELVTLLDKLCQVVYESKGIKTNYSKILGNIFIPRKRRIYSQNIPLVRHDFEKENYGLDDIKRQLLDFNIPDSDFNIFSDYSKGLFCIPWFRKFMQNAENIVDPKSNFIDLWEGCTYFKPNSVEAERLSERKNFRDQLEFFMDALKCKGVIITQSGDGVVGKDINQDLFEIRPASKMPSPQSVIGAGDCFVAFVTMALARGFNLQEASTLAFAAGSLYVQKKHNSPLCPVDLFELTGQKLVANPAILKKRNFTLSFTNGCFDLLHAGHLSSLSFAKKQGQKLCVAVNSDESVKSLKQENRPIINLNNRIKMLESLEFIDYIVVFDDDTPYDLIDTIRPDVLVKGADYKTKLVVGSDIVQDVRFAPIVSGLSTTSIIDKIKA